jgi:hypothetical protein
MGKTHMVEFAFGGTGQNSHHGAPYNPWDAAGHRSVGGSSSGAGVSLLEGSAVLAFGNDTVGSVRIPASMTDNAGLKVTIGHWPLAASRAESFNETGFRYGRGSRPRDYRRTGGREAARLAARKTDGMIRVGRTASRRRA